VSADKWTVCPKCKIRHEKRIESNEQILAEQYGKIDLVSYKLLEERLGAVPDEYEDEEMREDYELFMDDDGHLYISYSAYCTNDECDFRYNFKHEEDVDFK
jgi:hypothetical protein